jgi:hypothetical protein
MDIEVVNGTHADAPHSTPRHACVYHALQDYIYIYMKLFSVGATDAGQIRVTLKTA